MKPVCLVICLCFLHAAYANNYYFSSLSGNDSRTASEAQDPSTPWKTLNKLNSFFINLKPGDSILFKRKETFYGSITVQKSGSVNVPIVIGAYGSGENPIITSLIKITGWVAKGGGVWQTSDSTLGSSINVLLLNGVAQEMGRYPNSNAPNKGYLNFESHNGKTSITDDDLNTSPNWKGAELVLRPRHWILERCLITSHSQHTLTYTTSSPYEPYENYGYFIQNSIKTLDKFGEWYYDPSTKKLNIYFGTANPSNYLVQASTTNDDLVSSSSRSNIVFDNLTLKGSNNSSFFINNGSNIAIQNCAILFSGVNGAVVRNHKNLRIQNCDIINSNNNGLELEYGVANALIKGNNISQTAILAGMMQNGEGTGVGISFNGEGATIESNIIHKTGFIGLSFYGNDVLVKNNLIDTFCFVKDDGGGIYSHGELITPVNRKLVGNIIMHGLGAGPGTDHFDKRSVSGIYMDANIKNVEILGNTVTTCNQGIFIQSSAGMVIKNNTVFDNVRQMTMIRDADNNPVRNSVITQNVFFSKNPDQWSMYIMSSENDIKLFGRLDSNYYAKPIDDRLTIFTTYVGADGKSVNKSLDLNGWKKIFGQDKRSKKSAKQIVPFKINELIGENKFIYGGDFTNSIQGISATASTVAWDNSGMLDGGYLEITPTSRGSSIYMKVDAVTAGKNYLLSYSLIGSADSNMSIGASLKQTGSPYATLTPVQSRKIDVLRTDNEMIFSPLISEPAVNVTFKVDDQRPYYLDNIKFFEADADVTNPDDSIRFEYNATNINKSISFDGNYVDVAGMLYVNKIVLKPYTSAVLIKTSNKIKNNAPTVVIDTPVDDTTFSLPANVFINAEANDVDGTIEKVEFYNGAKLLKALTGPEYHFTLANAEPGDYIITAKATDNNGVSTTSSPVRFSVADSNLAPAVNIVTPVNNQIFSPFSDILVTANATDLDGSIEKVEFYKGTTLLKTDVKLPYSYNLASLAPGNYTITAKATDDKGLVSISLPVTFTVALVNIPPTVNMVSPVNNAVFASTSEITIKAEASDIDGNIERVEFYNNSTLFLTEVYAPYERTLINLAPGVYTITAKAIDNGGLTTTSSPVTFTVGSLSSSPNVSIITPVDSAVYLAGANIYLAAAASDADGSVAKVEFYNNSTLLYTATDTPYIFKWERVPLGNYTIIAKATDNSNLVTTSSAIFISVVPNKPPVISLTKPTENQNFDEGEPISLKALTQDTDGRVTRVEFYEGSVLIATKYSEPFTFSWKNVPPGNYSITARALDNWGDESISLPVNISVTAASEGREDTINAASRSSAEVNSLQAEVAAGPANARISTSLESSLINQPLPFNPPVLRLLPNPAVNRIQLDCYGLPLYQKVTLAIQNAAGSIIKIYPVTLTGNKIEVDISSLTPGVYIMRLSVAGLSLNKKFLKVN